MKIDRDPTIPLDGDVDSQRKLGNIRFGTGTLKWEDVNPNLWMYIFNEIC